MQVLGIRYFTENTQNRVERPACIFMAVGGQDLFNPAMLV